MARSMVVRPSDAAAATGAGSAGLAALPQEPACSQTAAMDGASVQLLLSVDLRLNFPFSVPEAKIRQSQRFQLFFRSSNSPEWDSSGYPASHSKTMAPIKVQHG